MNPNKSLQATSVPLVPELKRSPKSQCPSVIADSTSTTDFVEAWVTSHLEVIGGSELRHIRTDKYGRTLCWEFETSSHYLQFLAWDHAYCVDLHALNKTSGTDDYLVVGSCDDISGVTRRLDSFLSWMQTDPAFSRS